MDTGKRHHSRCATRRVNPATFTLEVGALFELPPDAASHFFVLPAFTIRLPSRSLDCLRDARQKWCLQPFQVVTLEAVPIEK